MRPAALRPFALPADLRGLTEDFTGREWVFHRIGEWLLERESSAFVVSGPPGTGKSALAARLVQIARGEARAADHARLGPGAIAHAHFCRAPSQGVDALSLVTELARRLATGYPEFRDALTATLDAGATAIKGTAYAPQAKQSLVAGVHIEQLHIHAVSPPVAFERYVRRPLEALRASGSDADVVVLIDGLDESLVSIGTGDTVVTLIASLLQHPAALPAGMRLLLTTRRDPRVLRRLRADVDLADESAANASDVEAYVRRRLKRGSNSGQDTVAARIAQAGEGNFLYARYVVEDLLSDLDRLHRAEAGTLEFPAGLSSVYRNFVDRELAATDASWTGRYRPLLGLLAIARHPGLRRDHLVGATGMEESEVDDALRTCAQFLNGTTPGGPVRLYHESFREFLTPPKDRPPADHQVYPREAHGRLSAYLMKTWATRWETCDDRYALEHLPWHLIEAGRPGEMIQTVTSLSFIRRCAHAGLLQDVVQYLAHVASGDGPEVPAAAEWLDFLGRESHVLGMDPSMLFQQAINQPAGSAVAAAADETPAEHRPRWYLRRLNRPAVSPEPCIVCRVPVRHPVALEFAADERLLVVADREGDVSVWETATVGRLCVFAGHQASVSGLWTGQDGLALSWDRLGCLLAWDVQSGDCLSRDEYDDARNVDIHAAGLHAGEVVVLTKRRRRREAAYVRGARAATGAPFGWRGRPPARAAALARSARRTDPRGRPARGPDHRGRRRDAVGSPDWEHHALRGRGTQGWRAPSHLGRREHGCVARVDPRRPGLGPESTRSPGDTPNARHVQSGRRDPERSVGRAGVFLGRGRQAVPGAGLTRCVVSPDGRWAATSHGLHDVRVQVWDLERGVRVAEYEADDEVEAITRTGSGFLVLTQDHLEDNVEAWVLGRPSRRMAVPAHEGRYVQDLTVSADGSLAASASHDGTSKVWDLRTGSLLGTLEHEDSVKCVRATPDGRLLLSGGLDQKVRVWELPSCRLNHTLAGHDGRVDDVWVDASGTRAMTWAADATVREWDLVEGCCRRVMTLDGGRMRAAAASRRGWLVAVAPGEILDVWHVDNGAVVSRYVLEELIQALGMGADTIVVCEGEDPEDVHLLRVERDSMPDRCVCIAKSAAR